MLAASRPVTLDAKTRTTYYFTANALMLSTI